MNEILVFAIVCTVFFLLTDKNRQLAFGVFSFILWFFSTGAELANETVNYELAFLYGAFALIIAVLMLMDRADKFGDSEEDFDITSL